jgi:PAP2 superfamily
VYRRAQLLLWGIALTMSLLAILAAWHLDRGLADPDGFLGPAWVRLPMLVGGAFAADLLPRTLWASRFRPKLMPEMMRARIREHWTRDRAVLVVTGVVTFYLTYVSYRNLKSFLPALFGDRNYDRELFIMDRALFLGHPPAVILHNVLGTDVLAHFLSTIYLWFLPLVPLALTAWLVWSRTVAFGYWFATSQCLAWTLGTASYYALPTLGPGFEYSWLYQNLAPTASSQLMEALINGRHDVNTDVLQGAVQSVAGFASLHCAITMLVALMAHATLRSRLIPRLLWANFAVTVVATLYFGWHYVADDVAGIVIALFSFYVGGVVSGVSFDRRQVVQEAEPPLLENA